MSLESILQTLDAEAASQITEIEQAARIEIEQIRSDAQAEAAAAKQKHLTAMRGSLQAEKIRILNRAKLEALQIILETREALMTEVLQAAANQLTTLSTTPTYPDLLQQLTQEAIDTLDVECPLDLHVQSRDVELMSNIVQELELSATVKGDLEHENSTWPGLGGLIVSTSDERISLVNTLAMRLQKVASLYRAQIAEMLFKNEGEEEE